MPTNGDTVLFIFFGGSTPLIGAVGVPVSLAELEWNGSVVEYRNDDQYFGITRPGLPVYENISGMTLTIGPSHSIGTPVSSIIPPLGSQFMVTFPSNANFSGSTEYTWSFTVTIEHWIQTTSEVVTRSYNTTGQIQSLDGTLEIPMTFTTEASVPDKPVNPAPADVAASIALGLVELSWDDGGGADDYDVYFGLSGNATLQSSGQAGTSWALVAPLLYNTAYEWRIDANNAVGTTTGDTWTFTALAFAPPVASGGGGGGGEFGGSGGLNNMVTVKRLVVAAANAIFFEDE